MGIVISADIGSSATKIIGTHGGRVLDMLRVETSDRVASLYGGIGKLLYANNLTPSDISAIYLTGAGSSFIDEKVYGIDACVVPEFDAIGNGALRLSGLSRALAVSMGTGTAFVRADADGPVHIGGTGVGGGTVLGLASSLPCGRDIDKILALASEGDLRNVDSLVSDVLNINSTALAHNLTASNFGKLKFDKASDADMALGIINMVFEVIAMMALFALRNDTVNDVVLIGALAEFPQAKGVFGRASELSGKNFIILPEALYATALGALPVRNVTETGISPPTGVSSRPLKGCDTPVPVTSD